MVFELGLLEKNEQSQLITVSFNINSDSILQVSAKVNSNGKREQIKIKLDKGSLSQTDIQRMITDAKRYQYEDNQERERVIEKNKLETYAYDVKHALEKMAGKLKEINISEVQHKYEETIRWLDGNPMAETEDFRDELQKLTVVCDPVMKQMTGTGAETL